MWIEFCAVPHPQASEAAARPRRMDGGVTMMRIDGGATHFMMKRLPKVAAEIPQRNSLLP